MRILRVIYVLAIAIALVFLVVAGVQAFYPGPAYPEYDPPTWDYNSTEYQEWQQEWDEVYAIYEQGPEAHDRNILLVVNSTEYQEWQQEWDEVYEIYEHEVEVHDRNIFFVVLPLGVVFGVGGTFMQRRAGIFGAGLILGGIGTMILAIVPYDLDNVLRFAGIAAILAVLIFVGYKVFLSLKRS